MEYRQIQQIATDWDEPGIMWQYHRFVYELERLSPGTASHVIDQTPGPVSRVIGQNPANVSHMIGHSEKGEPIYGFVFGEGPKTVSLVAGAHADEPVGPNTLYRLILTMLWSPRKFEELYNRFRFLIIPHVNPDGDAANAEWMVHWPDVKAFMSGTKRELPGRDIEFGYPDMRPENRIASAFWKREGPADLHISLHGMQFSEGFLLLINDEWEEQTRQWRMQFDRSMKEEGLAPHDHDRHGEKGFNYMGPGFSSTPKGSAMRRHFLEQGDRETADKFHHSSMEFHLGMNPAVLCMVTEFPLFLVEHSATRGVPENYLKLKASWTELGEYDGSKGNTPETMIRNLVERFNIRPLPLEKTMRLQLFVIQSGMDLIVRNQGR